MTAGGERRRQESAATRTVAVKVTRTGHVAGAHPLASPGHLASGGYVVHVEAVPAAVSVAAVVLAVSGAALISRRTFRVSWAALRPGAIVHEATA